MTNISVLMPSRNPGRYGRIAAESALNGFAPGDELVIQDACSTDGWVDSIGSDERARVVSEPDGGQADALNRALGRANGDYVGWLNADDLYFPGWRSAVGATLESSPDIIYGSFSLVDADGRPYGYKEPPEVSARTLAMRGCVVYSGAFFVRREFLESIGGFDASYTYCMDYELFLRAWSAPAVRAVRVPERLGALRIHPGTKTSSTPWAFVREARHARRVNLGRALRVAGELETVKHSVTVLTTPIRSSKAYRTVRERRTP